MLTREETRAQDIAHIKTRIAEEIDAYDPAAVSTGIEHWNRATLADFKRALIEPNLIEVNLAGGLVDQAYAVTRTNGAYRVIWLPWLDVFSLAVESKFGPVDINVHGGAIACFSSV